MTSRQIKLVHLRVRLVVQQPVKRMLVGLAAARGGRFIHVQRQAGDGFGR